MRGSAEHYHEGTQSQGCAHDQRMETRTNPDGSTRTIIYCVHCGMEW